ncbi:MAG: hypothetical protein ACOCUT_04440 [bacterium]
MRQIDKLSDIRKVGYDEVVLLNQSNSFNEYRAGVVVPREMPYNLQWNLVGVLQDAVYDLFLSSSYGREKEGLDRFEFNEGILAPRKPKDKSLIVCSLPIYCPLQHEGLAEDFANLLETKLNCREGRVFALDEKR